MREEEAFQKCLAITKIEAKNFYFGIALLPTQKRKALAALYALARVVDDIADDKGMADQKLAELTQLSERIQALKQDKTDSFENSEPLWGVYYASKQFPLPLDALDELVQGCQLDADGKTKYKTSQDTIKYCRLVAGSVGRLSLGVFGTKGEPTGVSKMADDLGVALQLTNILRDIWEDFSMGRCYIPTEDLERFNLDPDFMGSPQDRREFVEFEVERALEWYKKGFALLSHLDRRSFACTAAMSGIYYNLLKKIRKNPLAIFEGRVSLSKGQKARVAVNSLLKIKPARI